MRAVLLAAGLGTRLRPLTNTIPKCLVPIHGRPLLQYWFDLLFPNGIDRALVNTHWLPDQVATFVKQSRWRDRVDLVHEAELLGTGGTVFANRDWLGADDFLVAHADNLTDFDVTEFIKRHRARPPECEMTMLSFRTDDPSTCGILELDTRGVVQAFHEKVANPPGNLANGAVYIFSPSVLDRLAKLGRSKIDLSLDVIPQLCGKILAVELTRYHRDIGSMNSLSLANAEFRAPN